MNKPPSIREAGDALRRKVPQNSAREHRAIKAFAGVLTALGLIALISSVNGADGLRRMQPVSPVRSVPRPLSSYQSGLVETPNPVDNTQNQVVTGNVASGKHFRGAVPYRSPKSIDAPLGSTSLDSFMRYTTPSNTSGRVSGRYESYYSSTGTATGIEPGRRSIPVPGGSTAASGYLNRALDSTTNTPRLGIWSGSQTSEEKSLKLGDAALEAARRLQGLSSVQIPNDERDVRGRDRFNPSTERQATPSTEPPMTEEAYKRQVQELQDRLSKVRAEIAELERSVEGQEAERSERTTTPSDNATAVAREPHSSLDTKVSRRQELLQETARLLAATRQTLRPDRLAPPQAEDEPAVEPNATPRLRLYQSENAADPESVTTPKVQNTAIDALFLPAGKAGTEPGRVGDTSAIERGQAASSPLDRPMGPIAAQWEAPEPATPSPSPIVATESAKPASAAPKAPARSPKTLVALGPAAKEKFEGHLQAGLQYLDRGQFRRAADSFALAEAYKPNDPRVLLGKSHALFAAGQFASSAFFLGKAVELDTKYVLQRRDLVKIAGTPDAFLDRFAELSESIKTEGIPQLQLLLSYVLYQMNAPEEAKAAIDKAWKKRPTSASINLFRKAVHPQ